MKPQSLDELEAAGYSYTGTGKICSCGTQILWFISPPKPEKPRGSWMPFSALKDSRLVPHQAVCDRVKEFRAADAKHRARTERPKPKQLDIFGGKD